MSQGYLDKFRTSIPKTQGNQVLKRLIAQRDSGGIKTIDEFKARLKSLTTQLVNEEIKPTLTLYKILTGEDISSEQYVDMLEHIEDDLETAFTEADNLDEIIVAHRNLIQNVALKALRYGINELESKVRLYEFISSTTKGFDDILFNTFRDTQKMATLRSDVTGSTFFIDPRSGSEIEAEEDATVDLFGERLILGVNESYFITPRGAEWLANQYSHHGELDVTLPGSSVSNIIDGTTNTYWAVPILFSKIQPYGALVEICLKLPGCQDLNLVEIEPCPDFSCYLAQLDYIDANGARQEISSTDTLVQEPLKVCFNKVTASSLILRFRQDNYREVQFKPTPGESNFHKAVLGQNNLAMDIDSVADDLRSRLTSDFVISDTLSLPSTATPTEKYYQYTFGLDNIRPGYSTYGGRGIFISDVKSVSQPIQVGLKIEETRPIRISGGALSSEIHTYPLQTTAEDAKFHHGVIEYWLAVQSFSSSGALLASEIVPILPLEAHRVYHEQLIFTRKSSSSLRENDMASMRFFCDDDSVDVMLYKNGSLLAYGAIEDWVFVSQSVDSEITNTSSNSGKRMRRGIQINTARSPIDIYTVSYTPTVSDTINLPKIGDTLATVVDLTGDNGLRVVQDNVIIFNKLRNSQIVDRADIYLIVLLRRNSARDDLTPAVEEFLLATGSRDTAKFSG